MTVKMLLAFKKYQQNFLGSAYYNSKIVFSHWKEKKKRKLKKILLFLKHFMVKFQTQKSGK